MYRLARLPRRQRHNCVRQQTLHSAQQHLQQALDVQAAGANDPNTDALQRAGNLAAVQAAAQVVNIQLQATLAQPGAPPAPASSGLSQVQIDDETLAEIDNLANYEMPTLHDKFKLMLNQPQRFPRESQPAAQAVQESQAPQTALDDDTISQLYGTTVVLDVIRTSIPLVAPL